MDLDETDVEILLVLNKNPSSTPDAQEIKQIGDNLPDANAIHGKLLLMSDLGYVEKVKSDRFRIKAQGRGLLWGKEMGWIKILRLLQVGAFNIEKIEHYLGLPRVEIAQQIGYLAKEGFIKPKAGAVFELTARGYDQVLKLEKKPIAERKVKTEITNELITHEFLDTFYKKLVNEINEAYDYELYVATWVLLRKLFENLLIELLRAQFKTSRLELYYNKPEGRHHDFSLLIDNLEINSDTFKPYTKEFNNEFLTFLNTFKERANAAAHSIEAFITKDQIEQSKEKINHYCDLLASVIRKIIGNAL